MARETVTRNRGRKRTGGRAKSARKAAPKRKSRREAIPPPPHLDGPEAIARYLSRAFGGDPTFVSSAIVNAGRTTNMVHLTRKAGVSPSTLYRLLHTREDLKLRTALRILRALGMEVSIAPTRARS